MENYREEKIPKTLDRTNTKIILKLYLMRPIKEIIRNLNFGHKTEGRRLLRRPRCRWEDNIRMDLREIG
jgi:hypothetical protein